MSEVPKKRIRDIKYTHEKVGLPALRPNSDYSLLQTDTDIEREQTASRSYTATAEVQSDFSLTLKDRR